MDWSSAWDVLKLFVIPVGGGIPAGVLLARTRGFQWPMMIVLYFISDVILACVFEPMMIGLGRVAQRSVALSRMGAAFKKSVEKTTSSYGPHLGPFSLILVSFGVDPMTGRMAAAFAGHGFITGWIIAIIGDLFYFAVLMVSTLSVDHVVGDETKTTLIILVGMFFLPVIIRKIRGKISHV